MSAATNSVAMPLTLDARERLRDQQRQEASRLEAVLAAQRRLASEQNKADRIIEKAEHGVAAKQAGLDVAVVGLVETSGLARAAVLLGRSAADLARLVRAERRESTLKGAREAGASAVQA
jgi:pantothenate synthetase